jgi:Ca-activated chloride channel homolog
MVGEKITASRGRARSRTALVALAAAGAVMAMLVTGCSASKSGGTSSGAPAGKAGRPDAQTAPGAGQAAPSPADHDNDITRNDRAGREDPSEIYADQQPLSTFAVDVDTASYGYARRLITDGRRPDPTTIRPEEFVNAFRQDYRQPSGNGFTAQIDGARMPSSHTGTQVGALRLMRVGLQTRAENSEDRADAALTFVIDVSGSMGEPGKLDLVRDALNTLVDQLRPSDAVAIVAYDDRARVLREMTDVRNRGSLHDAINRLRPGGSTNLEAGLVTGYRVAREGYRNGATNRVILLSDGLANVGNTQAEPILRQVREAAAKKIALLGVGVGSDYGDALMEQLADSGDGFVVYVSTLAQARKVFVEQLPATLAVRALDAKVQVAFDAATVLSYRLIGYENRALAASAFRNDRVDGGEVGPGHAVTALYVVRLRTEGYGRSSARVADARVRWLDPSTREPRENAVTVTVGELSGDFLEAGPRVRQCYAAAYFAEVLRGSRYGGEVRLADLARIADEVASTTEDRDVADLAALIRQASRLGG